MGKPWKLDKKLENQFDTKILRDRYPDIGSGQDLQNLISDIAQNNHTKNIQATNKNGVWIISATSTLGISAIEFKLATRLLIPILQGVTQKFLNKTDSKEFRQAVLSAVNSTMAEKGYPLAKTVLKVEIDNNHLTYLVDVDEQEPCFIERIEIAFRIPKNSSLDVRPGAICDINKIAHAVDDLEEQIRQLGYTQLRMNYQGLIYIRGKTGGILRIMGILGSRIRYHIEDKSKLFLVDDLFSQEEYSGLDPTIVSPEAMSSELTKRYKTRGYADVEIEASRREEVGKDTVLYTYTVSPGVQYSLTSIQFEGTTVYTKEKMLEIMSLESFWQSSTPLDLEEIGTGIDSLKSKYLELGYWDVKIRDPRIAKDKSRGNARMIVTVSEGLRRHFTKVEYRGRKFHSKETLNKFLDLEMNDPIDRGKLLDFEQKIRETYLESGFLYAKINLLIRSQKDRKSLPTAVIVEIEEGSRVRIGAIRTVGLIDTAQKVVTRELRFKTGDWYRPSNINLSRKLLVDLGVFASVQIAPSNRNAIIEGSADVDLVIEVREGNSGSITFGPGYDIYRGLTYSAENTYNNLGGVGRQFSLRASLSQEKQQTAIDNKTLVGRKFGAGYVEPYILGLPINAKVSISHKATADEFWKLSQSGELSLNHKLLNLAESGDVSVFYGQKISKEEGADIQENTGVTTDNIRTGKTGVRFNLDWRNSKSWPTSGSLLIANASWARYDLGGELKYFRWELVNNYYNDISNNFVIAYGGAVTFFHGIERENVPFGVLPGAERLNAGGPDFVRGFQRQLGPYIRTTKFDAENTFVGYDKVIIGGDRRIILKGELRYRASQLIGISTFVDSGNAFLSPQQLAVFERRLSQSNEESAEQSTLEENVGYEISELLEKPGYLISRHYYSFGTACNILTPIGAINLAYAWPWKEPKSKRCQENESYCLSRAKEGRQLYYRGRFELSVGARF